MLPALLTALIPVVLMAVEQYGLTIPMWTGDFRFQSIILMACLAVTALLCHQVIVRGTAMLRRKRCVSELLISLSALAALADCGACLLLPDRSPVPPYGAVACLALVFAQWGISRESRGMYDTFRTVSLDDEPPYLVTDTDQGLSLIHI